MNRIIRIKSPKYIDKNVENYKLEIVKHSLNRKNYKINFSNKKLVLTKLSFKM